MHRSHPGRKHLPVGAGVDAQKKLLVLLNLPIPDVPEAK
jgi:hypothetical protein